MIDSTTVDYLDIRIPIAHGYQPTKDELVELVAAAVEKAMAAR